MGHGSIEPDNSGGTVDIEGFFLRYEGREPPLPIQRGRQLRSGGVKDKKTPRAAHTTGALPLLGGRRHREESLEPLQYFLVDPDGSVAVLPANRSVSRSPETFEMLPSVRD